MIVEQLIKKKFLWKYFWPIRKTTIQQRCMMGKRGRVCVIALIRWVFTHTRTQSQDFRGTLFESNIQVWLNKFFFLCWSFPKVSDHTWNDDCSGFLLRILAPTSTLWFDTVFRTKTREMWASTFYKLLQQLTSVETSSVHTLTLIKAL